MKHWLTQPIPVPRYQIAIWAVAILPSLITGVKYIIHDISWLLS